VRVQHRHANPLPILSAPLIAVEVPHPCPSGYTEPQHNTYENAQALGADTFVAFDVFCVADGRLVEHWVPDLQVP